MKIDTIRFKSTRINENQQKFMKICMKKSTNMKIDEIRWNSARTNENLKKWFLMTRRKSITRTHHRPTRPGFFFFLFFLEQRFKNLKKSACVWFFKMRRHILYKRPCLSIHPSVHPESVKTENVDVDSYREADDPSDDEKPTRPRLLI